MKKEKFCHISAENVKVLCGLRSIISVKLVFLDFGKLR